VLICRRRVRRQKPAFRKTTETFTAGAQTLPRYSGYAALSDRVTKTKRDEMESFVFAET
jgi:hypothetical protein